MQVPKIQEAKLERSEGRTKSLKKSSFSLEKIWLNNFFGRVDWCSWPLLQRQIQILDDKNE